MNILAETAAEQPLKYTKKVVFLYNLVSGKCCLAEQYIHSWHASLLGQLEYGAHIIWLP